MHPTPEQVRSDLETLLLPLLELLYSAHQRTANQMYMLLIILLMLSQDASFAQNVHRITLQVGRGAECAHVCLHALCWRGPGSVPPGPPAHPYVVLLSHQPACLAVPPSPVPSCCSIQPSALAAPAILAPVWCPPYKPPPAPTHLAPPIYPPPTLPPTHPPTPFPRPLQSVPFYRERSMMRTSLGSLLVVLLLRTAHYNLAKLRDVYLHTNTLAALANLAPHMSGAARRGAQSAGDGGAPGDAALAPLSAGLEVCRSAAIWAAWWGSAALSMGSGAEFLACKHRHAGWLAHARPHPAPPRPVPSFHRAELACSAAAGVAVPPAGAALPAAAGGGGAGAGRRSGGGGARGAHHDGGGGELAGCLSVRWVSRFHKKWVPLLQKNA